MMRDVLLRTVLAITILPFLFLGKEVEGRPYPEEIWSGKVGSLSLAFDPNGYPWVVWEGESEGGSEIFYSLWGGAGWSKPQPVAPAPQAWDRAPDIAFDQQGEAWVVWSRYEEGESRVLYSRWEGGGWSPPGEVPVYDPSVNRTPSLAVGPEGTVWLAWAGLDGRDMEIFFSRWMGEGWERPRMVSGDDRDPMYYDVSPSLAVDGAGNPWLLWVGHEDGLFNDEIFWSRWAGAGWSPEHRLNADNFTPDMMPTLVIDGRGRPWAAWVGKYAEENRIFYSRWEGGRWSPEEVVEADPSLLGGERPNLAVGPGGEPQLVWMAYDREGTYIAYSRWEGNVWSAPQMVAAEGEPRLPAIEANREGVWLLWARGAPGKEALLGWKAEGPLEPLEGRVPSGMPSLGYVPVHNRYVAFGDSITLGGYISYPYYPYPIYEDQLLDENIALSEVINEGKNSERLRGGKDRIVEVMDTYHPEFLLVMEGTNDVSDGEPPAAMQWELEQIIKRVREKEGGKLVLATIPPRGDGRGYDTMVANDMIRSLAASKVIPLADVWQAIVDIPNWLSQYRPDKIHPDGPLMPVIAETFYQKMLGEGYLQDTIPPSSRVSALPLYFLTNSFTLRWSGSDGMGSGIAGYDIQYKDGETGVWTGWLTNTLLTQETFSGERGHRYYFRCRARDVEGNEEGWPTSPDYDTSTLLAYGLSGRVWNNRDLPVAVAQVSASPHGDMPVYSNYLGSYTVPLVATGTVTVTVSQVNFGDLPPMYGVEVPEEGVTGVDFWLPPLDDVVANGQFEEDLSSGWSSSGSVQRVTDTVHTGLKAVYLNGTASLSQTVTITPTAIYSPTLSFMYIFEPGDPGNSFEVKVGGTSVWSGSQTSSWSHVGVDLSGYPGEVEISFILQQTEAAPPSAYLDEVSLGSAGGPPGVAILPLIMKDYE